MLAEALAKKGVATIRYDKRGVGQSTLGGKLEDIGFDDFVSDAAALVAMARVNDKLSGVYLFGHSEGALIALEVASTTKVDGVITAAGPGRPARRSDARAAGEAAVARGHARDTTRSWRSSRRARRPSPRRRRCSGSFQPSLAKFMRGMLLTDPKPLAAAYKGKLTVVQGDNDVQVTVDKDAQSAGGGASGRQAGGAQGRRAHAQARSEEGARSAELSRSVAAARSAASSMR